MKKKIFFLFLVALCVWAMVVKQDGPLNTHTLVNLITGNILWNFILGPIMMAVLLGAFFGGRTIYGLMNRKLVNQRGTNFMQEAYEWLNPKVRQSSNFRFSFWQQWQVLMFLAEVANIVIGVGFYICYYKSS